MQLGGADGRRLDEGLEGIALLLEPVERLRQGGTELVDGLQGVVEGDDAAIAGIVLDVGEHVVGRQPSGVVARNEVPHDDAVFA